MSSVLIEIVCCCLSEKCKIRDAHVTSPRLITTCGKYGAWLLGHKLLLKMEKQVKTTKTNETQFVSAKKASQDCAAGKSPP